MLHTTLSSLGLKVSRACMGTMTFGGQTAEDEAIQMADRCISAGINFFDTAVVYQKGESERILGKALRGKRAGVIVASKVGGVSGKPPQEPRLSRQAIVKAAEESLQRLQTDYLDICYLHQPDYEVPLEQTLAAIEQLVQQGKIRYPATSNYGSWQVCRLLWLAEKNGYQPALVAQPMYNVLARGIEQEFLPMTKELGVNTVAYNPLAGGLLTGKHQATQHTPGTRFDGNRQYQDRYWHQVNFEVVETLKAAASTHGRSLVSLALNWLLHHSPIDCIILGASRLDQLEQNLKACDEGPLPAELLAECDAAWTRLRGSTPQYNR